MSREMTILLLEDDPILRINIEEILLEKGFNALSTANSEEAITACKNQTPDLAILDIHLENSLLDGIQTAQIIKDLYHIPILFLTALADKEILERAKRIKPAYYLLKPCSPLQLEIAIDLGLENFIKNHQPSIHDSLEVPTTFENRIYPIRNAIFIKNKGIYTRILVNQIFWIEASNSSVVIVSEIGKFVFSTNLKNFQSQFQHPTLIKIHRSFIVNIEKVIGFDDNMVQVNHGTSNKSIPIGTKYKEIIHNILFRLKSGN